MKQYSQEHLEDIDMRLHKHGHKSVTKKECLFYMSRAFDIPIEHLEAKISQIKGKKLSTVEDLAI